MKRIILFFSIVTLVCLYAKGEDNDNIVVTYYSLSFDLYDDIVPHATLREKQDVGNTGSITIPQYVPFNGKNYEVDRISSNAFAFYQWLYNVNIEARITDIEKDAFHSCGGNEGITISFRYAPPKANAAFSNYITKVCFNAIYEKEVGLLTEKGYLKNRETGNTFAGLSVSQFKVPTNSYWYTTKHNTLMKPTHPENFLTDSIRYQYVYHQGSATLERELTYIPSFAFIGKGELTSFTIPETVTEIQQGAFRDCIYLEGITMRMDSYSDGIEEEVSSITQIGDDAFRSCQSLKQINMPTLYSLGRCSFMDCTNLQSITVGQVTTIPFGCFKNCKNLTDFSFEYCKNIGDEAFSGCTSLKQIDLSSVQTIGKGAFAYCTLLDNINDFNVISLDNEVFRGCSSLKSAKWGSVTETGENVLADCAALDTIAMPKLSDMGEGFARNCSNLKAAIFDSSLHTIAANAFKSCSQLDSLYVPSLWSVRDSAFYGCTALKSVDLSRVRDIRNASFAHCSSLQEICLGSEVVSIGKNAFDSCSHVSRVVCMTIMPPVLGDEAFKGVNTKNITLYVSYLSVEAYKNSDWGKYEWKQIYPYYDIEVSSTLCLGDTMALVSEAQRASFVHNPLKFESSDDSYVSVDSNGVVIAHKLTDEQVPYVTVAAQLDNTISYRYLRFTVVPKQGPAVEPSYTITSELIGTGGKLDVPNTPIRAKQWVNCTAQADKGHFLKRVYALETGKTDTVPLYQSQSEPMQFCLVMPSADVTVYAEFDDIQNLVLKENEDNEPILANVLNEVRNVTLERTFREGRISTLCLPFDLPDLSKTPFKDAHVEKVVDIRRSVVDGLLFTNSEVNSIQAGYPYVVRFYKAAKDLQFNAVRITAAQPIPVRYYCPDSSMYVTFQGLMKPQTIYRNDSSTLFYFNNVICYSTRDFNIEAFKGYFILDKSDRGIQIINWRTDNGFTLKEADEDDSEEDITGFVDVKSESKGVYKVLYDGNLFILRDDKIYNAQGQRIQ